MTADELFRASKLQEAIQALGGELRDRPTDAKRRTFLFEMLCFAGEYSRAEKQLNILADANEEAGVGALVYRSAIRAERQRQLFFESKEYEKSPAEVKPRPGKLNGEPFQTIEDADPRMGPRLEVFIAGEYVWLPFEHIGSLRVTPPKFLRDLLWASSAAVAGPAAKGQDMGELIVPVLYPNSFQHPNDVVKLGRETEAGESNGAEALFGQRILILDGERAVPFLDVRTIEFDDMNPAEEEQEEEALVEAEAEPGAVS